MKNPFSIGHVKIYEKEIVKSDLASFETGEVHPFYGTFALARDAEWSSRLFVLEMKDTDEEGIGTFVNLMHLSPALEGEQVRFEATLKQVSKNSVICTIEAWVGNRQITRGETGQKIVKKDKLAALHQQLKAINNG